MKIKNLYVVNITMLMSTARSLTTEYEESFMILDRICEKIEKDDKVFFKHLEDNKMYPKTEEMGIARVEEEGIPLSDYVNWLGFRKKNDHNNQEEVYQGIKYLRKKKII